MLSLLRDQDVIEQARAEARELVDADPTLAEHPGLARMVSEVVDEERAEYLEKS
jgi:ATP-dependent DNA helicase RecG